MNEQSPGKAINHLEIVPYGPQYQSAFRDLNVAWISAYFKMEASDYKVLDNPGHYIINNGGYILVALYNGEPVGVCGLLKMDDPVYQFELVKMAVSPAMQGKKIGWQLGLQMLQKARELGATAIYIETNSILKPAIALYQKLGFKHIERRASPYERADVQMELIL